MTTERTNKMTKKKHTKQCTIFQNEVAKIIKRTPYTNIEEACLDFCALISFAKFSFIVPEAHLEIDGEFIPLPIRIDNDFRLLKQFQRLEKSGFVSHVKHPETSEKLWYVTPKGYGIIVQLLEKTNVSTN